jgi:hypothetical protein
MVLGGWEGREGFQVWEQSLGQEGLSSAQPSKARSLKTEVQSTNHRLHFTERPRHTDVLGLYNVNKIGLAKIKFTKARSWGSKEKYQEKLNSTEDQGLAEWLKQ